MTSHGIENQTKKATPNVSHDIIIVGGGLHGCLTALAILHLHPETRLIIIEAEPVLGGSHTWSFFPHHVPKDALPWVDPLIEKTWRSHRVAFPAFKRILSNAYSSITSDRLNQVTQRAFNRSPFSRLLCGATAVVLKRHSVTLASGETLHADLVLDARGQRDETSFPDAGVQKFFGIEATVQPLNKQLPDRQDRPHSAADTRGIFAKNSTTEETKIPCLMDARVAQHDGYRFFYTLPLKPNRWLVEETFFSDGPVLDLQASRDRIDEYLRKQGFRIVEVHREEQGKLSMPWRKPPLPSLGPIELGLRGGWFHPATGYSTIQGIQVARLFASHAPSPPPPSEILSLRRKMDGRSRFFLFLNWMLFRASHPSERWRLMQRFYRFSEPLMDRYYARRLAAQDPYLLLFWRPPDLDIFRIVPARWRDGILQHLEKTSRR